MYRVILVDDEPLILAGIASLINWEDYDCTIVGKATNGPSAYEMILAEKPDIVITDIRMPVLNGLELIEKCMDSGCRFAFIVLTNLEDFQLARQAMVLGACEYLVKLDLSPEDLASALERAKDVYQTRFAKLSPSPEAPPRLSVSLGDSITYYFRQLLVLRDPEAVMPEGTDSLYQRPFVMIFSVRQDNIHFHPEDEISSLTQNTANILTILRGLGERFFPNQTFLQYDRNRFLLVADVRDLSSFEAVLSSFCAKDGTGLEAD